MRGIKKSNVHLSKKTICVGYLMLLRQTSYLLKSLRRFEYERIYYGSNEKVRLV